MRRPPSLDSSAWIEIFHGGPNAERFLDALGDPAAVIVSPVAIYEVWKYTILHADESRAQVILAFMRQGTLVPVDADIAILAAALSIKKKTPMADSLIYATAVSRQATLWTQDQHFEGLDHVRYFPKINP